MYDEVQIVMCGVWTWWWAWLWRWAVVVAVAVGLAVAVVVGVVVAVAVTSGGNCARSALTCYCYGCPARFFTREFDSLLCFAGMLAAAAVAGRGSLPANSMVCPVSRVCLSGACPARFFTREFLYSPCQELYLSILLLSYL